MRRSILLALAAVLAACADARTVLGPTQPAFDIVDGRVEGGNPHFFWLPPIGAGGPTAGAPAAGIEPEVGVCVLAGDACGDEVAWFTTLTGTGSEIVRADAMGGHWIVNWHTGTAHDGAGLDPAATYRIRVLASGTELGHADVRAATGKARKDIDPSLFVVVQPGQTLPIRFRIEEGAVVEEPEADPVARQALAVGPSHACALTTEGAAHCWGSGWSGELGNGAWGDAATPVPVAGEHRFLALAMGSFHSCGLDEAGAAWCWGSNSAGILGTGITGGTQATPVAVAGGLTFVEIEAGNAFTCGRTAEGAIHCWGRGSSGQLGNGATGNAAAPVPVAGGLTFVAFDLGAEHGCGLTSDGAAWCWGANLHGQVGNGSIASTYPYIGSTTPQPVSGGPVFANISSGARHTCALTSAGEAWCWGAGFDGQAGDGSTAMHLTAPVAVAGGHVFRTIDAAASHTCAVDTANAGWCWGSNSFGQTGTGSAGAPARILEPAPVQGALSWSDIRGGELHSCGVTTAGQGLCWGYANLGNGSAVPSDSPVAIAGELSLPAS